jgi:cytochrome c oxidase subunit II
MRAPTLLLPAMVATALGGCRRTGIQHVLDPHGPAAADIHLIWMVFFWLSAVIFVIVVALLGYAMFRPNRADETTALTARGARRFVIIAGVAVPAVILLALIVFSTVIGRRVVTPAPDGVMAIDVTGHQFWWEIRYRDTEPWREFRTANEIHIPVGEPVLINLRSRDVIHSFWVPNLQGKIDMIPGRDNAIVIQADNAGVYRGQCAEFCGTQHALMGMLVIAQPRADFERWRERQLNPDSRPAGALAQLGHGVFMQAGCAACHAIRGTDAFGSAGPDLTNFGLRHTIGAATLPNRPGHLGGWIADPQGAKPGNLMPAMPLDGESLNALIHYLLSLR